MKLYNDANSPNCIRVRAVAFELGVNLDLVDVDMRKASSNPELLALNPNGKIPVLVDGDFVLWESRSINAYLASLYPARNLYRRICDSERSSINGRFGKPSHLGPPMQKVAFERVVKARFGLGEPDEEVATASHKETNGYLSVLETRMIDRLWVAGELSLADFALASTFMLRKAAGISLDDFPGVTAWIDRVETLESWQRAVATLQA